jgi:hypothetical protein
VTALLSEAEARANSQCPSGCACRAPRPKHASEPRGLCRSHVSASRQVRPGDYDARTCGSRFLEVDPVEGGSANDYDYVEGDPVNKFDLDGNCVQVWQKRCRGKKSWWSKTGRAPRNAYRSGVVPFHRHFRLSVQGCVGGCWSVTYQHGQFYKSAGCCGYGSTSPSLGWGTQPKHQGRVSLFGGGGYGVSQTWARGRSPGGKGSWTTWDVGPGGGAWAGIQETVRLDKW